jgi:hypothetical protein
MRVIPDRLFARALLLRAVAIWVPIRVLELVVQSFSHEPGTPPTPFVPLLVAIGIGVIVSLLLLVDVRRRGELVLLANLGTDTRSLLALGVGGALLLEAVIAGLGVALARVGH